MPVNTKIQVRRGTASQWTSQVLAQGEIGFETDSGLFKIGDGSTAWSSLPYAAIKSVAAGGGISVNTVSGVATVSLSDPSIQTTDITDFLEGVQDVIGNSGVISGFGTSKSYDDAGTGFTTVSVTGMTNSLSAGSGGIYLTSSAVSSNTQYTVHLTGIQPSTIVGVTSTASELNYVDITTLGTAEASKALVTDSSKNIYGINNLSASGTTNLGTLQVGSNATVTGNLVVNGTISSTGNLTVGGNLLVNGNTVTVNSTTVTIDDPIFTLGGDTAGINDNKDRGIEFKYNNGTAATGFFGYSDSNDAFVFITGATNSSEVFTGPFGPIKVGSANVTGTMTANAIAVTSTTVVTNLNADKLDGQDGSYYSNWDNLDNRPVPITKVILTGDVAGTGSVSASVGADVTVSVAATVQPSSVALGTDTTGQYASTITAAGSGLTATSANANGATAYTITSNASASSGNGTIVLRDSTGSFSAGNVTANSFIKAGGTSSQFLKGDGSVDTNTYITSASIGNGTLTLAVSGSGLSGSASFTANQSGGSTFTVTSNATASSGAGTLVLRNSLGGFEAGAIVADSFSGNGSSLTSLNASNLSTGTVSNSRLNVASTSGLGISTFSSSNFAVDSTGLVTIKSGGVANSNLANSTITLGSSTLTLGATTSAVTGLTSLAATNFYGGGANITSLNASNISAGTIGVSYLPSNIPITNLASSGITFGSTFQALGTTITTFAGLTAISGTSTGSPTTLTNCVIDGGTP
jgi:hypothetical protein